MRGRLPYLVKDLFDVDAVHIRRTVYQDACACQSIDERLWEGIVRVDRDVIGFDNKS